MVEYLDKSGLNYLWGKIKSWVLSQGFLTSHQSLAGYIKQGGVIDTHAEGSHTLILDSGNDLYAFYQRGGTCRAYEVETSADLTQETLTPTGTSIAALSEGIFNGYLGYNQSGVYSGDKFVVYDLVLPVNYAWGTTFYWSFGMSNWKPDKMKLLISTASGNFIQKYSSNNCPNFGCCEISNGLTGFKRLRIVLSKYSRLSVFGIRNYGSIGLPTTYMNRMRGDDHVYRHICPAKTNNWNLGTNDLRWKGVYATTFYGALDGNAATATKATQDASGNNIEATYQKKADVPAAITDTEMDNVLEDNLETNNN